MLPELKTKVLQKFRTLEEGEIVKDHVYKCINDGAVCFNGMIAEIVNGCKYDPDDRREAIDNQLWDDAYDWYRSQIREDLLKAGLEEDSEEFQKKYYELLEDPEIEVDYSDGDQMLQEDISNDITIDLKHIYEREYTISDINVVHEQYVRGIISFPKAVKQVIMILENQE